MTNQKKQSEIKKVIQTLSPIERKILPHIEHKDVDKIIEKSKLDRTSVLRALMYLSNKGIINLKEQDKQVIKLDVNGILYKRKGLPERRLLNLIEEKRNLSLKQAEKQSKLNDNEFKAALGALKRKALIDISNNTIILQAKSHEITKKSLEEQLIESLPINLNELKPEQKHAFQKLKNRKKIIKQEKEKQINLKITELGQKIIKSDLKTGNLIENLTPEMIKSRRWKGKSFRRYDIKSPVPKISGGKRHFVNQAIDYARKIWTELGFKEMQGNLIQSSFWNFDALFTAQDHPVREMQDTFYIEDIEANLPDKETVNRVKKAHEQGTEKSKGWQYQWQEKQAKKMVLRTHTTCLSALTLYKLSKLPKQKRKGKFFSLGKCFRNETVDWSHGFEFFQTEGIVVGQDVNFRHLLGYLKEFYKKMGFEKIRFAPAYFPYTEPSVEISVWHPEKKVWLEMGGAGMFRPEISIPLIGEYIPVLAWGQGFDRIIMDYYKIKDLREMYKNDLNKLREIKFWTK